MNRIVILGAAGSGKTTLGQHLAKILGIATFDLDDLFWLPKWTPRPIDEFTKLIEQVTHSPQWIICGNYSKLQYLTIPKAEFVIWLDIPFSRLLWRILNRGVRQWKNKEFFCNGNQQSLKQMIWLIRHLFLSYRRKKRHYRELIKTASQPWFHFTNPKEVEEFIKIIYSRQNTSSTPVI